MRSSQPRLLRVTATAVWIGSKGPYAVSEIDPQTNQVTKLELPGDPCGGLAADAENLWVPLCGKTPKLARVDLKKRELTGIFNVGPAVGEGGIVIDKKSFNWRPVTLLMHVKWLESIGAVPQSYCQTHCLILFSLSM